jgi:hypothetical protein
VWVGSRAKRNYSQEAQDAEKNAQADLPIHRLFWLLIYAFLIGQLGVAHGQQLSATAQRGFLKAAEGYRLH